MTREQFFFYRWQRCCSC